MKIVMLGPVYPYKGGISHYTGLMYRALSKTNDVYMMSYKLQYPKILFKREQRDYENDSFKIENTDFYVNTANPFNWLMTAKKIRKLCPDLVILQWWHPYFAPCYWTICKFLSKKKVLFVCHNVFPHERFPMDKLLTKMVLKGGDYYIVHSLQDGNDLVSIKENAVYKQTVLPTYNAFKFENMAKEEGRKRLNVNEDEKILLFFGFVREYKGLDYLLKAMPMIVSALDKVKLFIVGDFDGDKEKYVSLIQENRIENYIEIYDGYIPDREVEKFFAASDLVVLPYRSATQSAVVQVAYGFEKPVVVTNVGGLPEVVADGKTGYVVEKENAESIAEAVIDFFHKDETLFKREIEKEEYKYSWERMVEVIMSFGN